MYLTSGTLVPYLMDRRVLSAAELLDDDITIVEAGRRNRNFKVLRRDGTGFFVKQIPLAAAETMQSVQREATLYALADSGVSTADLKALMPQIRHYDKTRHLLAVDLVPNSQSLTFYQMRVSAVAGAMEDIATQLGTVLSTCHGHATDILSTAAKQGVFPVQPPWILSFSDFGETMMPNMSGGAKGVLAAVRQEPGLKEHMALLKAEWQRGCLIHGDLKWENFLVSQPDENAKASVQLIDWELADLGDAAWDVACVLASFVQPVIVGRFSAQGQFLGPAPAEDIARAQACCKAFWTAYTAAFSLTAQQQAQAKDRCARFAAARLVLTAYEIAQATPEISASAALAIRTATSIFNDPRSAVQQLFGLADPGA
ncbi:aminoglycoside phosphotransferase family protein [Agrobacterium sp. lyk4-40-TYG-31]|uniref:aminoglycoside phosphotransferase family protein n=1 Tax=Agrobacterium sp. lyk4-40-TYG-31 TaxID=3040276 RepID=UPI0025519E33|nr:aminoglycoside phosphotransferase family protein [Agrobacterium sp. lyk4-40-TYG-31]